MSAHRLSLELALCSQKTCKTILIFSLFKSSGARRRSSAFDAYSFQIAWEYLERSGELEDGASASRFLSDAIETMILRGQRSRLAISNRAIGAYQRFRSSGDAASGPVRSSA